MDTRRKGGLVFTAQKPACRRAALRGCCADGMTACGRAAAAAQDLGPATLAAAVAGYCRNWARNIPIRDRGAIVIVHIEMCVRTFAGDWANLA